MKGVYDMVNIINGQAFYDEQDIYRMFNNLCCIDIGVRQQLYNYVSCNEYGMDREPLLNIVSNPLEYNIDYLYRFDSDVTEKFIRYMEVFGLN